MYILGIDTSCDETSAAVLKDDRVLSNVIFSQIEIHKKWGGVMPSAARVAHEENIDRVIEEALKRASKISSFKFQISNLDAVAVTVGPGLAIALGVGIAKAKEICKKYNKKLIAVNHMEGHLLSSFIEGERKIKNQKSPPKADPPQEEKIKNNTEVLKFPGIGILISGGHTQIVRVDAIGKYKIVGDTLDDAMGEAFDKVAKMLGLGYPGGEIIEKLALAGNRVHHLPIPMLQSHNFNFSFSGLKTASMYFLQKYKGEKNKQFICDFCASFQFAAIDSVRRKLEKYLLVSPANFILCGGGVMNNLSVRRMIRGVAARHKIQAFFPAKKVYNCDNAAMIALAGCYKLKRGEYAQNIDKIDRLPNYTLLLSTL
jgi:N6-L-threonylcarbamoyladenine synthase